MVSICIILAVIIIIFVRYESTRPFKPDEIIGAIKCKYYITKPFIETEILSSNYKNISDIDITIDDKRIEFNKKYIFNKEGYHDIIFYLNNNETMDYMFKNITSLISAELYSRKNIKIKSMIGSFEQCINLNKFINDGFDTSQVTSMHNLFYNTQKLSTDINKKVNIDNSILNRFKTITKKEIERFI